MTTCVCAYAACALQAARAEGDAYEWRVAAVTASDKATLRALEDIVDATTQANPLARPTAQALLTALHTLRSEGRWQPPGRRGSMGESKKLRLSRSNRDCRVSDVFPVVDQSSMDIVHAFSAESRPIPDDFMDASESESAGGVSHVTRTRGVQGASVPPVLVAPTMSSDTTSTGPTTR